MTDLEIRVLSKRDLDPFWKLRLRALREEPEAFGAAHEEFLERPHSEIANQLRNSSDSFFIGAFERGLTGMVGFYRRQGMKLRHKGTICCMYVAPESRGQGVARALMLAAIARAAKLQDMEEVVLTVVTTNLAARKLYQSLGFETYGLEKAALKLDTRFFDEEMMSLKL